jgi:hypothetical protein
VSQSGKTSRDLIPDIMGKVRGRSEMLRDFLAINTQASGSSLCKTRAAVTRLLIEELSGNTGIGLVGTPRANVRKLE